MTSCGSVMNLTYDQNEAFIEKRNSEVGENISELYNFSQFPEKHLSSFLTIEKIDKGNVEYRFVNLPCSWATIVNSNTKIIKGWRYLSAPEDCKHRKYYQGAW